MNIEQRLMTGKDRRACASCDVVLVNCDNFCSLFSSFFFLFLLLLLFSSLAPALIRTSCRHRANMTTTQLLLFFFKVISSSLRGPSGWQPASRESRNRKQSENGASHGGAAAGGACSSCLRGMARPRRLQAPSPLPLFQSARRQRPFLHANSEDERERHVRAYRARGARAALRAGAARAGAARCVPRAPGGRR